MIAGAVACRATGLTIAAAAAEAAAVARCADPSCTLPLVLPPPPAGQDEDRERLLAFKESLANGADKLSSWQPGTDPCAWEGVNCSPGGRVTRLCVALCMVGCR